MSAEVSPEQAAVCGRFGLEPVAADPAAKVGISRSVREGLVPLDGLRHPLEEGTTGLFLWAGEDLSDDPDCFGPLRVAHLADWCLKVLPHLALRLDRGFCSRPTTRTCGPTPAC